MDRVTTDNTAVVTKLDRFARITVLAGIAEFEADLIKDRQIEGIAAAKAIRDAHRPTRPIARDWRMR